MKLEKQKLAYSSSKQQSALLNTWNMFYFIPFLKLLIKWTCTAVRREDAINVESLATKENYY